jgi:hypothetical protein
VRCFPGPRERFARTRPLGVLVLRLSAVRRGELVPLAGPPLPVPGRIAVPSEEPDADLAEDAPPPARAPFLAICLVAQPAPREPVQILSAYVHPCASNDRLLLVDSDLERHTLVQLLSMQSWLLRKRDVIATIEKPLEDLGAALVEGEPPRRGHSRFHRDGTRARRRKGAARDRGDDGACGRGLSRAQAADAPVHVAGGRGCLSP